VARNDSVDRKIHAVINNPFDFDLDAFDASRAPPTLPDLPSGGSRRIMPPLPTIPWAPPVVPRSTLNRTARRPISVQGSALGEFLGPLYGRCMPARSLLYAAVIEGDFLYLGVAWGVGEVDSLETAYINGEALPASVVATHYTGTTTQVADPTLAGVITDYADTLIYSVRGSSLGVVHSVFKIPAGVINGQPQLSAIWKGRKVYDPRDVGQSLGTPSTWLYSTNPALCLADLLSNELYGAGRTLDWATVEDVADECDDTLVSGAKRREIGLAVDRRADIGSWIDTLRTYAGCFVVQRGDTTRLVADRPATATRTISSFPQDGRFSLVKRGNNDVPTVVRVDYTDTTQMPWRSRPAYYYDAGVLDGSTRWAPSNVSLPGIQSHEQAYREAKERLLKLKLTDLDLTVELFDDSLKDEIGDVVAITHPVGLTAKEFRILNISALGNGPMVAVGSEYSATVYSDDEVGDAGESDTDAPSPLTPPLVTGLSVAEEIFQKKDGVYASRLVLSWTAASYPYVREYEACLLVGADVVWTGFTADVSIPSAPVVQENVSHTCKVRVVSMLGVPGDWTSTPYTPLGNLLPPADVTGLTVYEVGGEIRSYWNRVVDIGLVRYLIRIGLTTQAWADLDDYELTDSLRFTTKDVPPGTWRFWVAALDAADIQSTNPVYKDVEVTSDADAFFVGVHDFRDDFATWVLSNIYQWTRHDKGVDLFTYDSTDTVNGALPSTLDTYTNAIATYHGNVSSSITTPAHDYGAEYQGNWRAAFDATAVNGTVTTQLGLSADDISYTWGILSINDVGRYAKNRATATTTSTIFMSHEAVADIRLDVVASAERGIATTGAGGKASVTLDNDYTFVKSIMVAPANDNTGQATAQWDNVSVSGATDSFDIYAWISGTLTTGVDVSWEFKGV